MHLLREPGGGAPVAVGVAPGGRGEGGVAPGAGRRGRGSWAGSGGGGAAREGSDLLTLARALCHDALSAPGFLGSVRGGRWAFPGGLQPGQGSLPQQEVGEPGRRGAAWGTPRESEGDRWRRAALSSSSLCSVPLGPSLSVPGGDKRPRGSRDSGARCPEAPPAARSPAVAHCSSRPVAVHKWTGQRPSLFP